MHRVVGKIIDQRIDIVVRVLLDVHGEGRAKERKQGEWQRNDADSARMAYNVVGPRSTNNAEKIIYSRKWTC